MLKFTPTGTSFQLFQQSNCGTDQRVHNQNAVGTAHTLKKDLLVGSSARLPPKNQTHADQRTHKAVIFKREFKRIYSILYPTVALI